MIVLPHPLDARGEYTCVRLQIAPSRTDRSAQECDRVFRVFFRHQWRKREFVYVLEPQDFPTGVHVG